LISAGFSPAEVAASLGIPKEQISENIKALRREIRSKLID
jgi:biotin operon repressor